MALKNGYVTLDTEGKLYRVRDKNFGKGKPYIVWGSNLSYEAAHDLKERTCGAEKSRTARIEEMTIPIDENAVTPKGEAYVEVKARSLVTAASPPDPDPNLEAVRRKALAAARATAAQAQARANAVVAVPAQPNGESDVGDVPDHIEAELADLVAADADLDLA